MGSSVQRLVSGMVLALGLLLASGCTGYSTYPRVDGASLADPNGLGFQEVVTEGLRYVATRRPLEGPYAVNLPVGMVQERMDVVVRNIEDDKARLLTRDQADLPRVHVTRVWLRASRAEIDILRPVAGVDGPEGAPTYESYTLRLEGGLRPWKVIDARRWMVGTVPAPGPYWFDEAPENPNLLDDEGVSPEADALSPGTPADG